MIKGALFSGASGLAKADAFGFFPWNIVSDAVTFEPKIIEDFALETNLLDWCHALVAARSCDFDFRGFILQHLDNELRKHFVRTSL